MDKQSIRPRPSMKPPKHYWVLRQYKGPRTGWYWCGLGNPLFVEPREGTPYLSREEARRQARYMRKELGMYHFTPEKLVGGPRYPRHRVSRRARARPLSCG